MNNLLLDEHPLLVMPKLATLIGLNEAIVLQQVHYWLIGKEQRQQDYIDGHYWVYNTYDQWQAQFPFWSIRTLKRIFTTLENSGFLLSANYNKINFDKTKWYSIDYCALNGLFASYQNGTSIVPTCHYGECQNDPTNTIDYTKITTEKVEGLKVFLQNKTPKHLLTLPYWKSRSLNLAMHTRYKIAVLILTSSNTITADTKRPLEKSTPDYLLKQWILL